jgi:hypothetical protein
MRSQVEGLSIREDEQRIDPDDPDDVRYWARKFRASPAEIRQLALIHHGSAKAVRETLGVWDFGDAE